MATFGPARRPVPWAWSTSSAGSPRPSIAPRPWVYEGQLAVREVVTLSMSFDHRIIDGQVASQFLADVGAMVTDPRLLLTG